MEDVVAERRMLGWDGGWDVSKVPGSFLVCACFDLLRGWQQMGIGMSVENQRERATQLLQGACGRDLVQVF